MEHKVTISSLGDQANEKKKNEYNLKTGFHYRFSKCW